MGRVLYIDRAVAVCDGETTGTDAQRLDSLLSIEVDGQNELEGVKKLLTVHNADFLWNSAFPNEHVNEIDRGRLKELGFNVKGEDTGELWIAPQGSDFENEHGYGLVEIDRVLTVVKAVQYLARLFLESQGKAPCTQQPLVQFQQFGGEKNSVEKALFAAIIPGASYFLKMGRTKMHGLDINAFSAHFGEVIYNTRDYFNRHNNGSGSDDISAVVKLSAHDLFNEHDEYGCLEFRDIEQVETEELHEVAAGCLLESLLNLTAQDRYRFNRKGRCITEEPNYGHVSLLADAIIGGKIGACPYCGRPKYMPRANSKPFCRQSHQTRYHEKARRMFEKGASVAEVAATFPAINRKTIEGWV